jgi:hypothetical protein
MPIVHNDALIDIFPLILRSSSDKQCYLCNHTLDLPLKVSKLPIQYQICCLCMKTLRTFAKKQLTYSCIMELIERVAEKFIVSQKRLKRKDFTKLEFQCLVFFGTNSFREKDEIKERLKSFFILFK